MPLNNKKGYFRHEYVTWRLGKGDKRVEEAPIPTPKDEDSGAIKRVPSVKTQNCGDVDFVTLSKHWGRKESVKFRQRFTVTRA